MVQLANPTSSGPAASRAHAGGEELFLEATGGVLEQQFFILFDRLGGLREVAPPLGAELDTAVGGWSAAVVDDGERGREEALSTDRFTVDEGTDNADVGRANQKVVAQDGLVRHSSFSLAGEVLQNPVVVLFQRRKEPLGLRVVDGTRRGDHVQRVLTMEQKFGQVPL